MSKSVTVHAVHHIKIDLWDYPASLLDLLISELEFFADAYIDHSCPAYKGLEFETDNPAKAKIITRKADGIMTRVEDWRVFLTQSKLS